MSGWNYFTCFGRSKSPDPTESQSGSVANLDGAEFKIGDCFACGSCDLHLGTHPTHGKVALKKARVDTRNVNSEARRRFEREAAIWKRVSEAHPNILRFLGAFTRKDQLYLVSPYMEKGDAFAAVTSTDGIDKFQLLAGIASGLSYLHDEGIVHGDIKAKNVLIGEHGEALICDFGIAKIVSQGMVTSTTARGAGTLPWMAPELVSGDRSKTTASDVFSFGMTIIEILSGKEPYDDIKSEKVLRERIKSGRKHPSGDPSHSPKRESYNSLWALSRRCRHMRPFLRPTMAKVRSGISKLEAQRVVEAVVPV